MIERTDELMILQVHRLHVPPLSQITSEACDTDSIPDTSLIFQLGDHRYHKFIDQCF